MKDRPERSYADHADPAEHGVGGDPREDVAGDPPQRPHDQQQVHHQLQQHDHEDGDVEVGEGEVLGDWLAVALRGEVPEEAAGVEEAVAEANDEAACPQSQAETTPGTNFYLRNGNNHLVEIRKKL